MRRHRRGLTCPRNSKSRRAPRVGSARPRRRSDPHPIKEKVLPLIVPAPLSADADPRKARPEIVELRAQLYRLASGRPRTRADEQAHERRRRAAEITHRRWA